MNILERTTAADDPQQPSFFDHLEFFNPERIIHHSHRHLHHIKIQSNSQSRPSRQEEQNDKSLDAVDIWDRLHVEYAFSYSRKLARLALHYIASFRFSQGVLDGQPPAALVHYPSVEMHTRIVTLL